MNATNCSSRTAGACRRARVAGIGAGRLAGVAVRVMLAAGTLLVAGVSMPAAAQPPECDRECLYGFVDDYMSALLAQDPAGLRWGERVRFTENEVALMIGDGLWGTTTALDEKLRIADPSTGNVLWLGIVEEHGEPAYLAQRLKVEQGAITEVESVVGRNGPPAPYAPTDGYEVDAAFGRTLPEARRRPRARMIALVEGYYDTKQLNDGVLLTEIADGCRRVTNGVATTHGDDVHVEGCREQLEIGLHKPVDRVRSRRFPIVDEQLGIVVALAFLDHAARYTDYETLDGAAQSIPVEYPNSHAVLELFRIDGGEITRIEGVTAFSPYLMPTVWVR